MLTAARVARRSVVFLRRMTTSRVDLGVYFPSYSYSQEDSCVPANYLELLVKYPFYHQIHLLRNLKKTHDDPILPVWAF